uniref:3-oxoacyl-[acyl-carrier-protein] reductase n=1 Tax=Calcidiscus leptoporus TaxID=127549 RepID=A0A7S0P098_9EUKA|mmetsp:Transcript_46762/g.108634  ORF Transcript_46762/g.108634 Transcript_46762/m.108634 type:complete len:304 (+) Transcript_46762:114-1025(+)
MALRGKTFLSMVLSRVVVLALLAICAADDEQACSPAASAGTGQLAGRLAVITGGSRGVGAELARVFAREGAFVVVNYFQSKAKAEAVAAEINALHGERALPVYGDVTVKEDMVRLVASAEAHFALSVSVVVNNALASYQFNPASASASIKTVGWAHIDQQMKGALAGAMHTVQAALPSFEGRSKGAPVPKVVNIGTNLVYNPVVTYYDYTAAKAALVSLTRNLAAELGPVGVRVNLVAGGLLETTDASALTTKEVFEYVAAGTPLRKTTSVAEFAEACVYFASDASNAVTGQSIAVDGGLTMA